MRFTKLIAALLSFLLVIQPVALLAQSTPQSTYQISENFAPTEENQVALAKNGISWAEAQESVLPQLFDLAQKLEQDAKVYESFYGAEKLLEHIDNNNFESEIPGVGSVEYRVIKNDAGVPQLVPRAVLYSNDTAYLLLDESKVARNSKHLQQYIVRTHLSSGTEPNGRGRILKDENGNPQRNFLGFKKRKTGRDLVIVSLTEGKMSDASYLPKPKPTQWKWWKEYFLSKYKKPNLADDLSLAIIMSGILQAGLSFGVAAIKSHMQGTPINPDAALFTGLYGTLIGTFNSTYREWTQTSGSPLTRVLKLATVSAIYSYGVVLFISPGSWGDRFATISLFTAAGLMQNASIAANATINSYVKDDWNQFGNIRMKLRLNKGDIYLDDYYQTAKKKLDNSFAGSLKDYYDKILPEKINIKWKRATVESQLFYLLPWSINLISLVTLASNSSLKIPGTGIAFPTLQVAAIPFAVYLAKWYSQKQYDLVKDDPSMAQRAQKAKELSDNYNDAWMGLITARKIREMPGNVIEGCANLLRAAKEKF